MSHYRVYYYKNLLSSDGHQFKCLSSRLTFPSCSPIREFTRIAQFEVVCGRDRSLARQPGFLIKVRDQPSRSWTSWRLLRSFSSFRCHSVE